MRLWTLHPRYLDTRGLVALWREGLLAQAVLKGQTRGYTRHPQLRRFQESPDPVESIAIYLRVVHIEAGRRGYTFDTTKVTAGGHINTSPIECTRGQLEYEWEHLSRKLRLRAPAWLGQFTSLRRPRAHPLFRIVPGAMAEWEIGWKKDE